MKLSEIELEIKKLSLNDNDILLVTVDGVIQPEMVEQIRKYLGRIIVRGQPTILTRSEINISTVVDNLLDNRIASIGQLKLMKEAIEKRLSEHESLLALK